MPGTSNVLSTTFTTESILAEEMGWERSAITHVIKKSVKDICNDLFIIRVFCTTKEDMATAL